MKYELALRLRDAGFPIRSGSDVHQLLPIRYIHADGEHLTLMMGAPYLQGESFIEPTLEELIEACGDGFETLTKSVDGFGARGPKVDTKEWSVGSTPTEAVAELYLALHGKMELKS